MYRKEDHGVVTYARGCKSTSSLVTQDTCDKYSLENCSTVGGATVRVKCRYYIFMCCKQTKPNTDANQNILHSIIYPTCLLLYGFANTAISGFSQFYMILCVT